MGRVKLKIKRLENINGRQATYAKRKHGIMKKANELSILCDIDIVLLMFSPTGKPSLCSGKRSSIEEVIGKFAQLTPQERAKRKLESLEALKKTFKKLDHDVNIQDFLGMSNQTAEDLTNQAGLLQTQLSEVHRRLSYWNGPEKINSVETLEQMENSVRESLNNIGIQKENFEKQQRLSLECTNQIQNGAHLSFGMGMEQQLQPLSWFPTDDSKNLLLPEDQNLLPHRDVECTASSSFGSYSGYFGTAKSSEISNSAQESAILNELTGNASLMLQVNGQFPFPPYNLNFLSDTKFQPLTNMSVQENPVDYHVNGILEAPRSGYDTAQATWASAAGPFSVSMFDDQLFSRNPN